MMMRLITSDCQTEFVLFLLSTMMTTALQMRRQSSSNLRAKGPPFKVLELKTAKAFANGALQTLEPLHLWCQIVASKSPYEAIPAKRMYFEHNRRRFDASLDAGRTNGSWTINSPSVFDAGPWICHGETQFGSTITARIIVYLRPVIVGSTRIDELQGSEHFKGSGLSVLKNNDAHLECPVDGYPKPQIVWKMGAKEIKTHLAAENALVITNVTEKDHGIYTCTASNTIPVGKGRKLQITLLDREIRVKSPYSWTLPCALILVSIFILATIIIVYERRKKKEKRKSLLASAAEED